MGNVLSARKTPLFPDPIFRLAIHGKRCELTYQQLFTHGHRLLKASKYSEAENIFEHLTKVTNRGPRAHVMLAICKAGLSDYEGAHRVLTNGFSQHPVLVAELQDVVVMARMGFKSNAIQDLVKLVNDYHELPSLCLWLGDMLAAKQRLKQAKQCWKLAIERDRPGGAVAMSAQQQLRQFETAIRDGNSA